MIFINEVRIYKVNQMTCSSECSSRLLIRLTVCTSLYGEAMTEPPDEILPLPVRAFCFFKLELAAFGPVAAFAFVLFGSDETSGLFDAADVWFCLRLGLATGFSTGFALLQSSPHESLVQSSIAPRQNVKDDKFYSIQRSGSAGTVERYSEAQLLP